MLAADWRTDYNANHPHSALGMMSPERFAASLRSPSWLAARGGDQGRCSHRPTLGSHSGWTDERGPGRQTTPHDASALLRRAHRSAIRLADPLQLHLTTRLPRPQGTDGSAQRVGQRLG